MQSSQVKKIELKPIKDNDLHFEFIEKRLRAIWKKFLYLPIIKELGLKPSVLKNSLYDLRDAIQYGRLQFYRGSFYGQYNAATSKELKALGAQWDRKTRTWKIPYSQLPQEIQNAIHASEIHYNAKIAGIDNKLSQILPEEISEKLKLSDHFEKVLVQTEGQFQKQLRAITITPTLTEDQRKSLASAWSDNMDLWVKDWTSKEIKSLRQSLQESVFAGKRNLSREKLVLKIIGDSHEKSIKKAKFLARNETRLLITNFKQIRYEDAGVNEYKWVCANRPHQPLGAPYQKGEVRHDHGILEGKIFRWDNPPVVDVRTGRRKNPGQDYNCRCFAIPIVTFNKDRK